MKVNFKINRNSLLYWAKKCTPFLVLILILVFAFSIRSQTFWISHWKGDEAHYIGLAMKLTTFGLPGYSMRGINVKFYHLGNGDSAELAFPVPAAPNDRGDMLKALIIVGSSNYDQPLYQNAFGFPIALALSHKLFADPKQPFTALLTRVPAVNVYFAKQIKPPSIFAAQFYAVIIPLFFCLVTTAMIFALGSILFSYRAGLYAAFLYSINPVSLLASQRIWADEMLTAFIMIGITLLVLSTKKQITWLSLCAGLSVGIAILAKQSAMIVIPAIWLFTVLSHRKKFNRLATVFFALFNKHFLLFLLGALIVSGPWFWIVWSTYHTPFFRPVGANVGRDMSGWYRLLNQQPHPYIIFTVGVAFLCPLLLASLLSLRQWFKEIKNILLASEERAEFTFLWSWILFFFFICSNYMGKEHRYMLPAFAAASLLAGFGLEKIRCFLQQKLPQRKAFFLVPEILIIFLLCANAKWSIPFGNEVVLNNKLLILKPFEPDLKKNPHLYHELSTITTERMQAHG